MKETLRAALDDHGYTTLTPVQTAVIAPDLEGCDLLVSAQTGSGKTLGFGLAIAPTLLGAADTFGAAGAPLALVIAPTRELALQVMRELRWLYAPAGATVISCVGGMDMRDERRALGRGAHVVVATPGRLRDHMMRGSLDASALRAVVLDEADEMLDLGFREDLEFILGETPETRQTLMFSATVPKSIAQLAENYQKDAVRVVAKSEAAQHADIDYLAVNVAERDIDAAVVNLLRFHESPGAIVFCNTRAMVGRLATRLGNRGFQVVALSGELSQTERTHALQAMRDGRARVCVATDVAARGIDLPNLDLVIHAELPSNHETLLHRSGRTGRAGRKGTSALIVPPRARKKAERLLTMAKLRADWTAAPSAEAVGARDAERLLAAPEWHEAVTEEAAPIIARLTATFTPEQVAAAYLRLYSAQRTAPEEMSDPGAAPAPRPKAEFGPSVWFSLPLGRTQNAEPRRILPILCKAGGMDRDDIGAIRIRADTSFVQVREASLATLLAAVGPDLTLEPGLALTRLDGPPDLGGDAPGQKPGAPRGGKPARKEPPKARSDRLRDDPAPKSADKPSNRPSERPRDRPTDAPGEISTERPANVTERAAWSPVGDEAPAPPRPDRTQAERTPRGPTSPSGAAAKKPFKSKDRAQPGKSGGGPHAKPAGKARAGDSPAGKPHGGKPAAGKPKAEGGAPARRSTDAPVSGGVGGMEAPRMGGTLRGPPPPKGKPSSKKNRARAGYAKGPGKGARG